MNGIYQNITIKKKKLIPGYSCLTIKSKSNQRTRKAYVKEA